MTLADLFPEEDVEVVLAGAVQISARALRDLVAPLRVLSPQTAAQLTVAGMKGSLGEETAEEALRLGPWAGRMLDAIGGHQAKLWPGRFRHEAWHPDHDDGFWSEVGLDAADDATRKAAAVLRVPAVAVALAARAQWSWSLTDEREHRLAVLLPGAQRDHTARRTLQAIRARITRNLLDELRPLVKDITAKKKRRTRR